MNNTHEFQSIELAIASARRARDTSGANTRFFHGEDGAWIITRCRRTAKMLRDSGYEQARVVY